MTGLLGGTTDTGTTGVETTATEDQDLCLASEAAAWTEEASEAEAEEPLEVDMRPQPMRDSGLVADPSTTMMMDRRSREPE